MRDRLQEFKLRVKELQITGENNGATVQEEEQEEFQQQAIIYEKEPIIERHLQEIQKLQNEINHLEEEVNKFSQQQRSLVSSMRRLSLLKRECGAAGAIRARAEHVRRGLEQLRRAERGQRAGRACACACARILAAQRAALAQRYRRALLAYGAAVAQRQLRCRAFIQRQLQVTGKELSEQEVSDMLQQGKWEVFNENLLTEAKITKAQLSEMEQRHKELVDLESQVRDVKELFMQISVLVEEQGETINNIEIHMNNTQEYTQVATEKFGLAVRYKKRNPCKVICCWCCPCCR